MAFRKFSPLLLCCFFLTAAGCANKQKTDVQQPGAMSNVAVVVTPKPGGGPVTTALNKGGKKNGDHCLLAMVKPADGPINSPYGNRRLGKRTKFHKGIDIGAPRGSEVIAAAGGKVIFCGRKKGYGRTVEIEHTDGVVTRYAHLDAIFASEGQSVKQSDRLGLVGCSGHATGPNLHFELLAQGRPVNPLSEGWINASSDDLARFAAAGGPEDAGVMVADADDGGMADVGAGIPDIRSARVKNADMRAASARGAKADDGENAGLTTASAKGGKSAKRAKSTGAKSAKVANTKAPAAKTASAKTTGAKTASAKAANAKTAGAKTPATKVASAKSPAAKAPGAKAKS